jgi:hypothetical protein
VQRLQAQQGYDYAAQFYPHPAWLYRAAEAPRDRADDVAATIAQRRDRSERPTPISVKAGR